MPKTEKRQGPAVAVARLADVRVKVVAGAGKGASLVIEDGAITVGSGEDCDLVLGDDSVSARHCELQRAEGGVWVRDLGSTNGIYLGEVRVREALAPLGSKLRLGDSVVQLHDEGGRDVPLSSQE